MRISEPIQNAVTSFHADWRYPRSLPYETSEVHSLFPGETR
jgi:hypothetical protein